MRNAMKKMVGLGAAVLALVVAAGACQASVTVTIDLTLDVDTVAKTWEVYATLTDPSSETLGLHGIYIDVWGSETKYGPWTGDLTVNDGTNPLGYMELPYGNSPNFTTAPKGSWGIGFMAQQQPGTVVDTGIELMGVMQRSLHQERALSGVTYNSILQGVGETAGSAPVSGDTIAWAYPVLVADGTYTGDVGWLNVSVRKEEVDPDYMGQAISVTVLPATLPTPSQTGASFATFSPMDGDDYRASVNIPEPATLALIGLGGLGLLLRRKRR